MQYPASDLLNCTEYEGPTDMADHKHGEMNIETQEKTFEGFVKAVGWSCVAIVVVLIFMAIVNG